VRKTVPEIIEAFELDHDGRPPDIIIHMGMASQRHYYSLETRARSYGYTVTDVDGEIGFRDGEAIWKKAGLPDVLQPGPASSPSSSSIAGGTTELEELSTTAIDSETADVTTAMSQVTLSESDPAISVATSKSSINPRPLDLKLLHTWHSHLPYVVDLRLSHDAGRYLCEFIYYTSLAHAYQAKRDRGVVFFHVPGWTDERGLARGKDVTVALIKALVEDWMADKEKEN
jgi:hypothetical protein